jgi:hypothetical protein
MNAEIELFEISGPNSVKTFVCAGWMKSGVHKREVD